MDPLLVLGFFMSLIKFHLCELMITDDDDDDDDDDDLLGFIYVYDEMSLQNGVSRLQPKGGHGHHNGLVRQMEAQWSCYFMDSLGESDFNTDTS
ncbi:hypothetical protein Syun_022943 [Stephania yunnanensis]|uniref:Uncharacterized protein n=1 Tax=Stephania yunnanensis TaxID=152371 RepID=A0AAP0I1W5_9MAGN